MRYSPLKKYHFNKTPMYILHTFPYNPKKNLLSLAARFAVSLNIALVY